MELWDLYDENRRLIGQTHVRGNELPAGCFHLVVHVWIQNHKGEYLISQRSANRPTFPLMWETVGGSVLAGEDSLTGAIREAKEEVGIDLNAEGGKLCFSRLRSIENEKAFNDILDVWLFRCSTPVALENTITDEVAQTRWMTVPEIKALYDSGKFVTTLAYFFDEIDTQ